MMDATGTGKKLRVLSARSPELNKERLNQKKASQCERREGSLEQVQERRMDAEAVDESRVAKGKGREVDDGTKGP